MSRSDKGDQKKRNKSKQRQKRIAASSLLQRDGVSATCPPSPRPRPPRSKGCIWLRARKYLATSTSFQRASPKIGRARSCFLPHCVCTGATRMPLLSCMLCITRWLPTACTLVGALGPRDTYIILIVESANPTVNRDLPATVCAMAKNQAYTAGTTVRYTAGFARGVALFGRLCRADSMSSIRKQTHHRLPSLVFVVEQQQPSAYI